MKKPEIEAVKGWQGVSGVFSACSLCGRYINGKETAYYQRVNDYKDGVKIRISCRSCADK